MVIHVTNEIKNILHVISLMIIFLIMIGIFSFNSPIGPEMLISIVKP